MGINESEQGNEVILRVKGNSSPQSLASAISHAIYDSKTPVLRAIGAGPVNQAVKAIAIARGFVAPRGVNLVCVPGFDNVKMPDRDVTAVTLRVIPS